MKILTIFLGFLTVERAVAAGLGRLRVDSPIGVNDALRVIEEFGEFGEFSQLLKSVYKDSGDFTNTTELQNYYYVQMRLSNLIAMFFTQSFAYVAENVREYCRLAVEITQHRFDDVTEREKRKSLRFAEKHEYCMFTAFSDWGGGLLVDFFDADLLLETAFFFQTIDPDVDSSMFMLNAQLHVLRHRYDVVLNSVFPQSFRYTAAEPSKSFAGYREAMTVVEKKITDFSHRFCSVWRPVVRHDVLLAETQPEDVQNQSPFGQYILKFETCSIQFWEKLTLDFQHHNVDYELVEAENQRNRIFTWNCKKILDSPEYRYQNYRGGEVLRRVSPPPSSMLIGNDFGKNYELSLDALRDELKSNSFYLKAVKYYNTMADVVLLVSIKEGVKVLRGIKLVLLEKCKIETADKLSVDRIRELRSTLSVFRSLFDELVSLILDRRRITVTDNAQKKSFDKRVTTVMRFLNVQNDPLTADQIDSFCNEIPKVLKVLRDEDYIDDTSAWTKFDSFYFTESILNIRELYSFSANNF